MSASSDDSIAVPPPIARHGQIEIDTFCVGCHYNLHGQPVSIDERLGFPICRCPECGRFHPAGVGVTASSVWLRRWATILLFWWIMIVLSVTIGMLFGMGGISTASIEIFSEGRFVAPNGQVVTPNYSNGAMTYTLPGSGATVTNPAYVQFFRPWYSFEEDRPGFYAMLTLSAVSLALGLFMGILCVSLLWHWPRYRYFLCALLPLFPGLFLVLIYANNAWYHLARATCFEHIGFQTAVQSLGLLIGVAIGRKVARVIVRTIIPAKPRQAIAFLWTVDGKKLPSDMSAK